MGCSNVDVEFTALTPQDFDGLDGLDDWRFVLGCIRTAFDAGSFPDAARLVASITDAAERLVHHPDLTIRYPGVVGVALTTHATGGLTTLDVDLAREISALAAERGAAARPDEGQALEIAIDTMDVDAIRPFWAAILGYDLDGDDALVDPRRQGPAVWFQQLDEPRPIRNRIHLDVSVPHDQADARVAAALAAGGRMEYDGRARAFWTLADVDGNLACVCTWQDRG